ncbi:MAG: hypothetical protein PHW31_03645 [Candidatus Pacebacteria bacterium]|nr:hypothetical protein [Candidatus Paceibacterota bacterium]
MSINEVFKKINSLEQELQKIKIQTFFQLPKPKQKGFYSEKSLQENIAKTRQEIWQKNYAKEIKNLS